MNEITAELMSDPAEDSQVCWAYQYPGVWARVCWALQHPIAWLRLGNPRCACACHQRSGDEFTRLVEGIEASPTGERS